MVAGAQINKAELLFRKIEDAEITAQLDKLESSKLANQTAEPQKANVSFDDFTSMDIRVGTITAAEKEETKKLLKLTIDTGIANCGFGYSSLLSA